MLIGHEAPQFETEAYFKGEIKRVALGDYRGKKWVVLFFYPGCFTFVCPTELAMLAEAYPELEALGTEVLSMSCDSVYSSKMWHEAELVKMVPGGIPFPMLADPGADISKAYGVFDASLRQNVRGHFIINPDGIVKGMQLLPPEVGRSIDEIVREVQALKWVAESKEVLPAGWRPATPGLKPRIDLAGQVWATWKPPKKG
jgi:alkyl hydroperoxide reductase subunit AhpC